MRVQMFRISKIPIFESNSQRELEVYSKTLGCSESQRYQFSKAIHNNKSRFANNV